MFQHRSKLLLTGLVGLCLVACSSPSERDYVPSSSKDAGSIPQTVPANCSSAEAGDGGVADPESMDAGEVCTCPDGYALDGTTCRFIDLCATAHGGCDSNAICTPGVNTRTCTCKTGYTGDGYVCTLTQTGCGTCDANATCHQVDGQNRCVCNTGYEGDGKSCTATGTNPCAVENGGCSPNATCSAQGTNVTCTCLPGYDGNGHTCTPNLCATNNGGCSTNATCTSNGQGGRTCTCNSGYMGDGVTCTPNPCATNNGGCDPNATCTPDGRGSRTCACKTNFTGDGFTCKPWNQPLGAECEKHTTDLIQSNCASGLVCMAEGNAGMCTQTGCAKNSDCGTSGSSSNICIGVDNTYCFRGCNPSMSNSCSRSGYVCRQGLDFNGGVSNFCDVDCRGFGTDWCGEGAVCNNSNGLCEIKTCTTSSQCGTGKVCGTVKNSPKVCITDCRTAWCPAGSTCNKSTGMCDSLGDFYKTCTDQADCATGELCITYTSSQGVCTPTCTSDSQCPQYLGTSACNVTLSDNVTKICTLKCSTYCPSGSTCTSYNSQNICLP